MINQYTNKNIKEKCQNHGGFSSKKDKEIKSQ